MPIHSLQKTKIMGVELTRNSSAEIDTKLQSKGNNGCVTKSLVSGATRTPKITFNVRVAVKETIHVNEYTTDELARTWYKKADFSKMKSSYVQIVQLLGTGRYPGDSEHMTCRGLEYRHREGATRRKTNKLNALYAVLDEQERQWNEGYDDDEELRRVYLRHSSHCLQAAHVMGVNDEEECKRLHANMIENEEENMSVDSEMSEFSMELMSEQPSATAGTTKTKSKGFARFFNKQAPVTLIK